MRRRSVRPDWLVGLAPIPNHPALTSWQGWIQGMIALDPYLTRVHGPERFGDQIWLPSCAKNGRHQECNPGNGLIMFNPCASRGIP